MKFNKPHLTLEEQLTLLENRGLIVSDRQKAKYYLGHLNYYRLSGYWFPFKQSPTINKFGSASRKCGSDKIIEFSYLYY